MGTIYVILAEKQYSSSKVLAAFDTEDAANKLKETIEAVEPRWTLAVQPIEMQVAPPKPFTIKFVKTPDVYWDANAASIRQEGDDFVATIVDGPVAGPPHRADPPEPFIPENPDGPGAA